MVPRSSDCNNHPRMHACTHAYTHTRDVIHASHVYTCRIHVYTHVRTHVYAQCLHTGGGGWIVSRGALELMGPYWDRCVNFRCRRFMIYRVLSYRPHLAPTSPPPRPHLGRASPALLCLTVASGSKSFDMWALTRAGSPGVLSRAGSPGVLD